MKQAGISLLAFGQTWSILLPCPIRPNAFAISLLGPVSKLAKGRQGKHQAEAELERQIVVDGATQVDILEGAL